MTLSKNQVNAIIEALRDRTTPSTNIESVLREINDRCSGVVTDEDLGEIIPYLVNEAEEIANEYLTIITAISNILNKQV